MQHKNSSPYSSGVLRECPTFFAGLRNGKCTLARETRRRFSGIVWKRNSDAQHEVLGELMSTTTASAWERERDTGSGRRRGRTRGSPLHRQGACPRVHGHGTERVAP